MRRLAALCVLLAPLACAAPRASLPIFGPGPLTNLGFDSSHDQANNNATQHALWSSVIGLAGYALWGRPGLRWACGAWAGHALVSEAFFHAPSAGDLGPAYASEVRTDLLSKIGPCAALVAVEALR